MDRALNTGNNTRANERLMQEREKAQAISRTYERRISAQKESINNLLALRMHPDRESWKLVVRNYTEVQDELLLHKATTQRIIDLLTAEEGARVINVDLIQAILDDGAEQERLRREAFHG